MNSALLTFLRSLGFGGLLGAGLFGTIYSFFLLGALPGVSLTEFTIVGGLLGAGFSQALERYAAGMVTGLSQKVSHYVTVAELHIQVRAGLLSASQAARIFDELTEQYFLGKSSGRDSLPKGKSQKKLPGDKI